MDCSPVLVRSWDMGFGPLMLIPSLAGREAQSGEVAERRVLAPASSLAFFEDSLTTYKLSSEYDVNGLEALSDRSLSLLEIQASFPSYRGFPSFIARYLSSGRGLTTLCFPSSWSLCCPLLYQSVTAAVMEYHRLSGLYNGSIFLQFWRLEVQSQGVGRVDFS